jgi:tRNA(Ile)-lysidine synthase
LAADPKPISLTEFTDLMRFSFGEDFPADESLAVGVSGGPDSMALCFLLSLWAQQAKRKTLIHALTVDHGLRTDSDAEAKQVGRWLKGFKGVRHKILTWRPDKAVTSRVQERAREARYALMASYMKDYGLSRLFLAHHLDDQAETVLFRLSRGTGLDGLSGMAAEQAFADGLVLCRPLLSIPKERLVQTCEANGVKFIDDPL